MFLPCSESSVLLPDLPEADILQAKLYICLLSPYTSILPLQGPDAELELVWCVPMEVVALQGPREPPKDRLPLLRQEGWWLLGGSDRPHPRRSQGAQIKKPSSRLRTSDHGNSRFSWLPSGCPQTHPCQHLLRDRNDIHLIPPARPVPLLFLCCPSSRSPMREMGAVPASSVPLIFSASHSPGFIESHCPSPCPRPGYQISLWDGSLLPLCLGQSTHHTAASYFSTNLIISLPYLKTTNGIPCCCQNQA